MVIVDFKWVVSMDSICYDSCTFHVFYSMQKYFYNGHFTKLLKSADIMVNTQVFGHNETDGLRDCN